MNNEIILCQSIIEIAAQQPNSGDQKQILVMEDDLHQFDLLLAYPVLRLFQAEESGRCNPGHVSVPLSP